MLPTLARAWHHAGMTKRLKRPRDPLQLAKMIGDIATGQAVDNVAPDDGANKAAVEFARSGGLKGGVARAKALPASERKKIAQAAALARWSKSKK